MEKHLSEQEGRLNACLKRNTNTEQNWSEGAGKWQRQEKRQVTSVKIKQGRKWCFLNQASCGVKLQRGRCRISLILGLGCMRPAARCCAQCAGWISINTESVWCRWLTVRWCFPRRWSVAATGSAQISNQAAYQALGLHICVWTCFTETAFAIFTR